MEVKEQAKLAIDAASAWEKIGDFAAIGEWHPLLKSSTSEGNVPGARRQNIASDGEPSVDQLSAYDDAARRYRYAAEVTALPIERLTGEFWIDEDGFGRSKVTWQATFECSHHEPQASVDEVVNFIRGGISALRKRYGD